MRNYERAASLEEPPVGLVTPLAAEPPAPSTPNPPDPGEMLAPRPPAPGRMPPAPIAGPLPVPVEPPYPAGAVAAPSADGAPAEARVEPVPAGKNRPPSVVPIEMSEGTMVSPTAHASGMVAAATTASARPVRRHRIAIACLDERLARKHGRRQVRPCQDPVSAGQHRARASTSCPVTLSSDARRSRPLAPFGLRFRCSNTQVCSAPVLDQASPATGLDGRASP